MTEIITIAAIAENNVIGKDGDIPWHISDDLKRFKELTLNHPVIMGRKTYQSILSQLGKPLPQRVNIILSRAKNLKYPGVLLSDSLEDAIGRASKIDNDQIYIIGGQSVYEQSINLSDKLEITEVHSYYNGDSFFPEIDSRVWNETDREDKEGYSFVTYRRL
jgi:dihydrofolate reductase